MSMARFTTRTDIQVHYPFVLASTALPDKADGLSLSTYIHDDNLLRPEMKRRGTTPFSR